MTFEVDSDLFSVVVRTYSNDCDCGYWTCKCRTRFTPGEAVRLALSLLIHSIAPAIRSCIVLNLLFKVEKIHRKLQKKKKTAASYPKSRSK